LENSFSDPSPSQGQQVVHSVLKNHTGEKCEEKLFQTEDDTECLDTELKRKKAIMESLEEFQRLGLSSWILNQLKEVGATILTFRTKLNYISLCNNS
jgi:hypothetical protein